MLKKNNCNVIAQPYGSVNDNKIIEFSVQNNISLYFTKIGFLDIKMKKKASEICSDKFVNKYPYITSGRKKFQATPYKNI